MFAISDTNKETVNDIKEFDNIEHPIKFKFSLDNFQKRACYRITNGDNVFVTAHTSAGKTVAAQWAIATAIKNGGRAIYTSPIKALSNQKYRDFRHDFKDMVVDKNYEYYNYDEEDIYYLEENEKEHNDNVGIITGDVQVNETANCLVMTTEILRNMIYNKNPILNDTEWVIFDEIHYMNDFERGRIWEEVITMLPQYINMVFLSATTPNAMEFSEWVGCQRKQKVYIMGTTNRPVPLQHYLHTGTSDVTDNNKLTKDDGFYSVVENNKYNQENTEEVIKLLNGKKEKKINVTQNYLNLIKTLEKCDKLPLIIFLFSRKSCQEYAQSLTSLDFTTKLEKSKMTVFMDKCFKRLSNTELPSIITMKDLIIRGIGVHHSGMLPLMKEIVEILFQKGFIKVLFATETFAMGVNMPARTVIFGGIKKHDGERFRKLFPGEYIQMSGRAGRRGLDDEGTVIVTAWKYTPDLRKMATGKPLELQSRFHLTYQTILNLLRSNSTFEVTDLLKSTFMEHNVSEIMDLKKNLKLIKKELENYPEQEIDNTTKLIHVLDYQSSLFWRNNIRSLKKILKWGRIVMVKTNYLPECVIIQHYEHNNKITVKNNEKTYIININEILAITTKIIEKDTPLRKVFHVLPPSRKFQVPYHFIDNYHILKKTAEEILALPFMKYHDTEISKKRINCLNIIDHLNYRIENETILLLPDYRTKYSILEFLGYIKNDAIQLKGQIACEINTADELLLTECFMKYNWNNLETNQIVSILSGFVCQDKKSSTFESLDEIKSFDAIIASQIGNIFREIIYLAETQNNYYYNIDIETYKKRTYNIAMVIPTFHWINGESFKSITEITDISDGSIVKTFLRLSELCSELENVAKLIGNKEMEQKMNSCQLILRRDIVGIGSLYIN